MLKTTAPTLVGELVFNDYQFPKEDDLFIRHHLDKRYSNDFVSLVRQIRNTFNECRNETTAVQWKATVRAQNFGTMLAVNVVEELNLMAVDYFEKHQFPVVMSAHVVTQSDKPGTVVDAPEAALRLRELAKPKSDRMIYAINQIKNLIMANGKQCSYMVHSSEQIGNAIQIHFFSKTSSEGCVVLLNVAEDYLQQ